jgi:hypothetical protein
VSAKSADPEFSFWCGSVTYRVGGDVGQIGSDTGAVHDIVERKLINERRELQKERKGLRDIGSASETSREQPRTTLGTLPHGSLVNNIPGQCHRRRQQQL